MNTCPELPKQLSTIVMRRAFASLFTEKNTDFWTLVSKYPSHLSFIKNVFFFTQFKKLSDVGRLMAVLKHSDCPREDQATSYCHFTPIWVNRLIYIKARKGHSLTLIVNYEALFEV